MGGRHWQHQRLHQQHHGIFSCATPQVLGRGERLEVLVEKTDSLGQQAFAFKRQARVLRRHMW